MPILNFISGVTLGFIMTVMVISHRTPEAGEVWSFTSGGKSYNLTVKHVNGACVIVDQAGVPITIPLDILQLIAEKS
jgi:hypothetical protein